MVERERCCIVNNNGLLKNIRIQRGRQQFPEGCGFLAAKGDNYAKNPSIAKDFF